MLESSQFSKWAFAKCNTVCYTLFSYLLLYAQNIKSKQKVKTSQQNAIM